MNAKAAKRIRYAVRCMGLKNGPTEVAPNGLFSVNRKPAKATAAARMIAQFKRDYKATPYHRRDVHQESHRFVLQVKHGNATRKYPA